MKLYIAEKPSLGRAIADVLPKPHRRGDGCIYVGNGDCVSWCVGHLLEQAEPDAYDPKFKKWNMEHLPIVPEQWQLKPKSASRKQLAVLRKLVREADEIIHAGDPDREGQLLVDQVLEFLKVKGDKKRGIVRCLINDLNPQAVTKALGQLRPNSEFIPLSTSALARSRADWLYGINMTRALTLQGGKVGYKGVLSVGRVQTPLLGLVVRRDEEIERFVSKAYYQLIAHLVTDDGIAFRAKWQPSEACDPWQDEEGRVLSKPLVENVAARIKGADALVTAVESKQKKQAPPLPFNLSALQITAAKRYSMSAKQVLDICQQLYERHKLLTYPRSDSRYLPAAHYTERDSVVSAITSNDSVLAKVAAQADMTLRSKAWDDKNVEAHHAIIPTAKKASLEKLSSGERNIYQLVARQYLAQFYPPFRYSDSVIELNIGGGLFVAKARETIDEGWKKLFAFKGQKDKKESKEKSLNSSLPALKKNQSCVCESGEILDKETTPPKYFDDASLLAAMTGIARYVKDLDIRKVLKETDGLGTEATRAGIIELLFTREFLKRTGKQIRATEAGRGLIHSLPEMATTADMTARWEMQLNAISRREDSYVGFMQPLQFTLGEMIDQCQSELPIALKGLKPSKNPFSKRKSGKRKTKVRKKSPTARRKIS